MKTSQVILPIANYKLSLCPNLCRIIIPLKAEEYIVFQDNLEFTIVFGFFLFFTHKLYNLEQERGG